MQAGVKSKYGIWEDGRRIDWFDITTDDALDKQLKDVEEKAIKNMKKERPHVGQKELNLMTFNCPQKFYENYKIVVM